MSYRNRISARLIVMGLALRAKLGEPDAETLAMARIAIASSFPSDDPLSVEVARFAELFPYSRYNTDALITAGDSLFRAVERSCWPSLPHRADLGG